jgi:hypothetical protein
MIRNEFLNKFNGYENVFVTKTTITLDEATSVSFYVVMDTTRLVYLLIEPNLGLKDVPNLRELIRHEARVARSQVASQLLDDLDVKVTEQVFDPRLNHYTKKDLESFKKVLKLTAP